MCTLTDNKHMPNIEIDTEQTCEAHFTSTDFLYMYFANTAVIL